MRKSQDIRTLCHSCKMEYWEAGYRTIPVGAKYKEICDKCRYRLGWSYVLMPPKKR